MDSRAEQSICGLARALLWAFDRALHRSQSRCLAEAVPQPEPVLMLCFIRVFMTCHQFAINSTIIAIVWKRWQWRLNLMQWASTKRRGRDGAQRRSSSDTAQLRHSSGTAHRQHSTCTACEAVLMQSLISCCNSNIFYTRTVERN